MSELVDTQHGVTPLLAGIAIMLCLHLVFKIGEFLWGIAKKKSELSDKTVQKLTEALSTNTGALEKIELELSRIKEDVSRLPKLKSDLRRAFLALRILSGESWPKIREEIMDEDLPDV